MIKFTLKVTHSVMIASFDNKKAIGKYHRGIFTTGAKILAVNQLYRCTV